MKIDKRYCFFCLTLFLIVACVKPYEPAVVSGENNFLVVDGIMNASANGVTSIVLSRTRRLSDTVTFLPELRAQIIIEDGNGGRFALQEKGAGLYQSSPLNLNPSGTYRLNITTANGNHYVSDYVPVKQTPPIDSLSWRQEGDEITFYLSTHDPQNNSRYYRWEFEEDWEYHAFYDSHLKFQNGQILFRDSAEQTFRCWKHDVSKDILLHSTVRLSQDLVVNEPIHKLPSQSPKFEVLYSILARQYALTKEAFGYWEILKRNTQQLGSLFDAQPSQLIGNIRNATDENEPVIGYVSAAVERTERIFVWRGQIANGYNLQSSCTAIILGQSQAPAYLADNPHLVPAYYVTGGGVAITQPRCVDCRLAGGTTTKPPFWPL